MVTTSSTYKTQIEYDLRNISSIRVNLGIVDPDASSNNTMSDNGSMFYSDLNDIDMGRVGDKRYMTMEHNRFILDGNGLLPPEVGVDTPYYQGYVSSEISNSSGTFTTNPFVTIDFSIPFKFSGLTFRFDKILGSYPNEMQITAFSDTTQVYNSTFYPDNTEYMIEDAIPTTGYCNQIVLTFKKTFPVRRRVFLEYIMFGIVKTFTDEIITDATWDRSIDLLSSKLSTNTFSFKSLDINKEYNPENASGFWQYIERKQPVAFEYGYQLDDGTTEWITGGRLYTNEDIKIDTTSTISNVTFNATSQLNQLTDTYYRGVYNATPQTLYSLAEDVFLFADLPLLADGSTPYYIDPALQNISTVIPIPEMEINKALQLIANAGRCILYVDRTGKIKIERANETVQDFYLTMDKMTKTPTISKLPALKSVVTSYTTLAISALEESVSKADNLSFASNTECRFSYEDSTALRITTTDTLAVVGTPQFYATSCVVTLIGSGTAEIFGKKLVPTTTSVNYNASNIGYDCPIENVLINTQQDAIDYSTWIAGILQRRNEYSVTDRGYVELDVMDVITTDTLFSTGLQATISSSKIKYNGTLSAETKFISKEVL